MEPITEASPRVFRPKFMGRMVGVGYLVLAVSGFDLFYLLPKLLVRANAAATAANIKAQEGLFLAGFAAALIGVASYPVVTVLLYRLYVGAGWLVFLLPPLARVTSRYVMLASFGDCLLVPWLSVKGVDEERWHEQATAAAQW